MSDRSPFTLTVRTRDVEAAKEATGLSFEDETEEGAATHLMDPEVTGGGESLLDALCEAGIPFTAQGDPHYAYNGYVAVFDGETLALKNCGLQGIVDLIFDPTLSIPTPHQQAEALVTFAARYHEVEAALVADNPIPRASETPA